MLEHKHFTIVRLLKHWYETENLWNFTKVNTDICTAKQGYMGVANLALGLPTIYSDIAQSTVKSHIQLFLKRRKLFNMQHIASVMIWKTWNLLGRIVQKATFLSTRKKVLLWRGNLTLLTIRNLAAIEIIVRIQDVVWPWKMFFQIVHLGEIRDVEKCLWFYKNIQYLIAKAESWWAILIFYEICRHRNKKIRSSVKKLSYTFTRM